ncbi:MAG: hypothetical protein JO210_05850 [Acidobacteriaceae bacterium]|nr:hypothetical protein [Acidobacteriaceae bacterium]
MAAVSSIPNSTASVTQTEQGLLAEQEQAYQQQEQIETESAMMQSQHDTAMAVIHAIAN